MSMIKLKKVERRMLMFDIKLHEQNSQPVLSIRTRTSLQQLPNLIGQSYERIDKYMKEINVKPSDAPFTAYYNLSMDDMDVEIGFPISGAVPGKDDITYHEFPPSKVVTAMYKGSYSGMEKTYEGIFKWIKEEGYTPTGVYFEYYYNSPDEVPENELLTKIVIPVQAVK